MQKHVSPRSIIIDQNNIVLLCIPKMQYLLISYELYLFNFIGALYKSLARVWEFEIGTHYTDSCIGDMPSIEF